MMATSFLSSANTLLSSSSSSSSTTSLSTPTSFSPCRQHSRPTRLTVCKSFNESSSTTTDVASPMLTKRSIAITLLTGFVSFFGGKKEKSNAAVLEADDDVELLEKVKKDRKKRLERQGILSSADKEKGYLQDLVYKLSEVGQAIEKNDLSAAKSVLGRSTQTEWVRNANIAFTKLSSSPEEKTEVDTFNSSLTSLISSVSKNDVESSKVAFVSSAVAFERWTNLTGLVEELKGL